MRRPSSVFSCSLLVLLTLIAATGISQSAWAQEVTASITGTVTDPSGAAVPGATVTATSQERGLTYTDVTNDSGLYRIAQLPVGTYALKVLEIRVRLGLTCSLRAYAQSGGAR